MDYDFPLLLVLVLVFLIIGTMIWKCLSSSTQVAEIPGSEPDILRNLTILYGFFFLFMSGLLGSAPFVSESLYIADPRILFLLIVPMAVSVLLIGLEIRGIMTKMGASVQAQASIYLLAVSTPSLFIWMLGKVYVGNVPVFWNVLFQEFSLGDLGLILILAIAAFWPLGRWLWSKYVTSRRS